jgi:hypothetical protein
MHIDDRTVGTVNDSQRRGGRLDEQQRGARAIGRAADRLSQRRRSHKRRDQHDVLNLACRQRITESGRLDLISPGHPARSQLIATFSRAFPSPENGRDHLICRSDGRRVTGDVEVVLIDSDPAGAYTFTSTMRTVSGAIDTPSTMSTAPPSSPNWFAVLRGDSFVATTSRGIAISELAGLCRGFWPPPNPSPPP